MAKNTKSLLSLLSDTSGSTTNLPEILGISIGVVGAAYGGERLLADQKAMSDGRANIQSSIMGKVAQAAQTNSPASEKKAQPFGGGGN